MDFYFGASREIGLPLYEEYRGNALTLIRCISEDKSLSNFDSFNRRFKIAMGLEVKFTDELNITSPVTRKCYALMFKISDLWFAFEHLQNTVQDVFSKDKHEKSKVDFYQADTYESLGFNRITENFNQLLWENVLSQKTWRREIYVFLAYLKNNTSGATQKGIGETKKLIEAKENLAERHVFCLAYGLRNLYVHHGVSAALGTKNYKVKECLYMLMYDTLILSSLQLGNEYCKQKIPTYENHFLPEGEYI